MVRMWRKVMWSHDLYFIMASHVALTCLLVTLFKKYSPFLLCNNFALYFTHIYTYFVIKISLPFCVLLLCVYKLNKIFRDGRIKLFGRDNTQALLQSTEAEPTKFLQVFHFTFIFSLCLFLVRHTYENYYDHHWWGNRHIFINTTKLLLCIVKYYATWQFYFSDTHVVINHHLRGCFAYSVLSEPRRPCECNNQELHWGKFLIS